MRSQLQEAIEIISNIRESVLEYLETAEGTERRDLRDTLFDIEQAKAHLGYASFR